MLKSLNEFLEIGVLETDSDDEKLAKKMVTFLPIGIGVLAVFWSSIYFYLGHYLSALIPFIYAVISMISVWRISITKRLETIQLTQLTLVLILPFVLMWTLGGYEAGSFVLIWAFFAPVAALSLGKERSIYWFFAFLILTLISAVIDNHLKETVERIPSIWIHSFFLLNTFCGFTGIYLMLKYYVKSRNESTQKILEREHKLLLEKSEELQISVERDHLTGLYNRLSLLERINNILSEDKNKKFALGFIDLDKFKQINDTLGHNIGDDVLIHVAETLSKSVRENDIVCRLGGDEFVILFEDIQNSEALFIIVQRIVESLRHLINFGGMDLQISCSLGVSIYPDDLTEEEKLLDPKLIANLILRNADTAMYKVKEIGRDDFMFYHEDMYNEKMDEILMENDLRTALKNDEFEVYYQPQINILNNSIIGMEALVRWNHPEKGIVSPIDFIPIAEKNGLIVSIDRSVMKKSMKNITMWNEMQLSPGIVSLNLSARQLEQDDFIVFVQDILKETGCRAEWIELEVTESHIMKDPEKAVTVLKELGLLGIKISIDDFGVGYSSLTYLKRLPIDKSFVDGLPNDKGDVTIVKAIIGMAKGLGLGIIAEGVENEEQSKFLSSIGCNLMQGYLCSKPLNSTDFEEFLKHGCQYKNKS
jgi:diguanylate cyclase (GGDEF)-like protein